MPLRMIALLPDASAASAIDLLRALYDRGRVDHIPPHLPLVLPFEEETPASNLHEMVSLIISLHQPFMLALAHPEHFFDGADHLLQFTGGQGADETQRLAAALYRDVLPQHRPDDPVGTPLERTALTVGRFPYASDAQQAATDLREKTYFLVVTQVGILEERDGDWTVERTLDLGSMVETAF